MLIKKNFGKQEKYFINLKINKKKKKKKDNENYNFIYNCLIKKYF